MESFPKTPMVKRIKGPLHMQSYPTVVHRTRDVFSQFGATRMLTITMEVGRWGDARLSREIITIVATNDCAFLTEDNAPSSLIYEAEGLNR